MRESIKERIKNLTNLINKYNREYYVLSNPSIEDREYDLLFDELKALEERFPEYKSANSPTLKVGSDLDNSFKEVKHTIPVLSLDKAYSTEELLKWINKILEKYPQSSFTLEPKIDGVSIVLYYKDGILEKALTRGNGVYGVDVTANVKTIKSIPLSLSLNLTLAVRGEIFIKKEDFESLNKSLETPYNNPRNLASGILRRIKSSEVTKFPLDIFVYDFFSQSLSLKSNDEALSLLSKLGFNINEHLAIYKILSKSFILNVLKSENEIELYVGTLTKLRKSLNYELDGIVVKLNEFETRDKLGYTAHHPKWALAYKFESLSNPTKIKDIKVQIGRTGRVTPVAKVDKVLIAGAFIENITLHNQDYIDALELNIGDIVSISRRGDVIPSLDFVISKKSKGTFKIPMYCPSCSSTLKKEGAHLFCPNLNCPELNKSKIKYFVSKKCMDIRSLSNKTVDFLFHKGFVRNIVELYKFDFNVLLQFEGFKDKKITTFKDSLEKSKKSPFSKLLLSLGIKDLGEQNIKLLFSHGFNSYKALKDLVSSQEEALSQLTSIQGIGEKLASNIIEAFNNRLILDTLDFFASIGFNTEEQNEDLDLNSPLSVFIGKTFCITGNFENLTRVHLIALLERSGAKYSSSISKNLDVLIVGEKPGSKLIKARKLGIKVIEREEFLSLIEEI